MTQTTGLWPGIELPKLDPDLLFELFKKLQRNRASALDKDSYSRQIMVAVSRQVSAGDWGRSLRRAKQEPEDVAQEIVAVLVNKSPKIKLNTPCPLVLMSVINVSIYRRLASAVRYGNERRKETSMTDREAITRTAPEFTAPSIDSSSIRQLKSFLTEKESDICRGMEDGAVRVMYRYLCDAILALNTIPTWRGLPDVIRRSVDADSHATVVFRLGRAVRNTEYVI